VNQCPQAVGTPFRSQQPASRLSYPRLSFISLTRVEPAQRVLVDRSALR
jgi:hypothetical protein